MVRFSLLVAERDSTLREVIRRHLDPHFVSRQDLDIVHAHLARDMGGDFMAVLKLHAEHRVGKGFEYHAVLFYCRLL